MKKKEEQEKITKFTRKRICKPGTSRWVSILDSKLTEKLPNEFRTEFKNNLDSHTTKYVDSYCGLYATD